MADLRRAFERADRFQRGLEDEFAKERADALGRTGRQLEEVLAAYRTAVTAAGGKLPADEVDQHLDAISGRVYALLVQRESSGLVADNLARIRGVYDIPDEAVRRIGITSGRRRRPSC